MLNYGSFYIHNTQYFILEYFSALKTWTAELVEMHVFKSARYF